MKRKADEEEDGLLTPKRQARGVERIPGRSTGSSQRAASQSPDSLLTPSKRKVASRESVRGPQQPLGANDAESSADELAAKQEPFRVLRSATTTPRKWSQATHGIENPSKYGPRKTRSDGAKSSRAPSIARQNTPAKAALAKGPPTKAAVAKSTPSRLTPNKATTSRASFANATPSKALSTRATPSRASSKVTPSKATPTKRTRSSQAPATVRDQGDVIDNVSDIESMVEVQAITDGPDVYFEKMASKARTSNNTLEKLPFLTQSECLETLKKYKLPYTAGIEQLRTAHMTRYAEWALEMSLGYTISLYGYGSKKQLLEQFVQKHFTHWYPCVTIQGYHPSTDMRRICTAITQALDDTGSDVTAVLHALDKTKEKLVVLVHNIDGENLRNEKSQAALVRILEHPHVMCICSIDHVKAPLLWDARKTSALNLLYHDATTFEPYTAETALQISIFEAKASKQRLMGDRGISWILQTLSQNAKTIFRLLLEEQISHDGAGVEATRLYELASQAFAVSSKSAFQAQLGEFLDHEIIVASKEVGLGEIFRVPFDGDELARLLQKIEE